jgi:hypothetical protein
MGPPDSGRRAFLFLLRPIWIGAGSEGPSPSPSENGFPLNMREEGGRSDVRGFRPNGPSGEGILASGEGGEHV